jgi:predicted MFS family arabinose efflux permease
VAAGDVRNYALVTGAYWGFTLTDGALRMLVLLHFDRLGYGPITIAFLFLFYEFFGIITNLLGGWIATRLGLKTTLYGGLLLQIFALVMLAFLQPQWTEALSVAYVMAAQALSGIAKDLTKMSSKSAIKLVVPAGAEGTLFKWVSRLTGSKNALKGMGFFVGGLLLTSLGFRESLFAMAAALTLVLLGTVVALPHGLGTSKKKVKFTTILSKSAPVNWLSAARVFLFGARDVWFVVGLPVFLASSLGWSFAGVGGFIASWFIGYGIVQAFVPDLLRRSGGSVDGGTAQFWAFVLALVPVVLVGTLFAGANPSVSVMIGLAVFGIIFAINSSIHSYLILAYTDADKVALNVGFYYMANAAGRLLGTLLSGIVFQLYAFSGCLIASALLLLAAACLSFNLPRGVSAPVTGAVAEAE